MTGVTIDAQNNVWVVHRGNDSLEANEKGMIGRRRRPGAVVERVLHGGAVCPRVRPGRQVH